MPEPGAGGPGDQAVLARIAQLEQELRRAQHDAALDRQAVEGLRAELAVMRSSTSWRVTAPLRGLGPLRTALQGPAGARRSLRSKGGVRAVGRALQEQGLRRTLARVREEFRRGAHVTGYKAWVDTYDTLSDSDRTAIRRHVTQLVDPPVISVVMATYSPEPAVLRAALASVQEQLYPHWQLSVCDDASPDSTTWAVLEELAARDPRVTLHRRSTNGGIAAATNDALAGATGEHVAFLDHDDVLAPHALYLVAVELLEHPGTDVVYSDEDKLDADGRRYEPHFKPQWNPDLLLAQKYLNHRTVLRRSLVQ